MNIAITLPASLCAEILEGRKKVEVRKTYPKHFDCEKDCVYVIIKGTHSVCCSFMVSRFEHHASVIQMWYQYSKFIRAPYAAISQYANDGSGCCAWIIKEVTPYRPALNAEEHLDIQHNPQQFIYV